MFGKISKKHKKYIKEQETKASIKGFAAGILFAPKKGKELRTDIKDGAKKAINDTKEGTKKAINSAKEKAKDKISEAEEKIEE